MCSQTTTFLFLFVITRSFIVPLTGEKQLGLPPLDKPSLRWMIKHDVIVVDKTKYLNLMLELKYTYFFLSRPRRFGKSLLVDVMNEFFNGEKDLFENTYIYKERPDYSWLKYPVIRIDFTDEISSFTVNDFRKDLTKKLKVIAESYNISCINEDTSPEAALGQLIRTMKSETGLEVVILLDEYDAPYATSYGKPRAPEILEVLQSFFRVLKAQNRNIHFLFFTGASTVVISEFMTSTTALDISLMPEYAAILGFTEEELDRYFESAIQLVAKEQKKSKEDIRKKMKMWHNGFRFAGTGERIYNPCSVISYLETKGREKLFWSKSGGLSTLLKHKFLQSPQLAYDYVVKYATGHAPCSGKGNSSDEVRLTVPKSILSGNVDEARKSVAALQAVLFHGGYLTIDEEIYESAEPYYILRFGNLEVEFDYIKRLSQTLYENGKQEYQRRVDDMSIALQKYEWEVFISQLNSLFAQLPYFMYPSEQKKTTKTKKMETKKIKITKTKKIKTTTTTKPLETTETMETTKLTETMKPKNSEAMYQFQMYVFMIGAGFRVDLEVMTNTGRADLVLLTTSTAFIFETKLEENKENPLDQCSEKYVQKYINSQRVVLCIGLRFSQKAEVVAWGVARFSKSGTLLRQDGEIKLSTTHR